MSSLRITIDGATTVLRPGRRYVVGGPGSDIIVAGTAEPLAEIRRFTGWGLRAVGGTQLDSSGPPVEDGFLHLPAGTGDVIVTLSRAGLEARLLLHPLEEPTHPQEEPTKPDLTTASRRGPAVVVAEPAPGPAMTLVFGCGPRTDVRVEGEGVAAEHATLSQTRGRYRLRDHGRGSGTFVEGRPILWTRLHPGMSFTIGETEFTLRADGGIGRRDLPGADLVVSGLRAAAPGQGATLVNDMSFSLAAGSLLAIVGPSGAGKSSLFRALLGELEVTTGGLSFRGLDLRTHGEQIRPMLGFVPQGDELYTTLTPRVMLRYVAMLRLPRDTAPSRREARIARICTELGLAEQLDRPIAQLSGGQRKRVSIALELLTHPSLLMLDEPTSGLDARRDRDVMKILRRVAGDGCTVLVVTHSTDNLKEADRVLAVTAGGRPGYFERPEALLGQSGTPDYADLMSQLSDEAVSVGDRYQRQVDRSPTPANRASPPPTRTRAVQPTIGRQLSVLVRRQRALLWSRGWSGLGRPLVLASAGAALTCAVTSSRGLDASSNPGAAQTLALLTTLCILTGQALTYNEIVNEYPAINREHRTGTIAAAVVLAKWLVFGVIAVAQAGVVCGVFLAWRGASSTDLFGSGGAELFGALALTSVTAMSVGLLISATSANLEQAVGLATASAVAQVALNGVAFNLVHRGWLDALSLLLPSRWGVGAVAASIDLGQGLPLADRDALWEHAAQWYAIDLGLLVLMSAATATGACLRLRHRLANPAAKRRPRRA